MSFKIYSAKQALVCPNNEIAATFRQRLRGFTFYREPPAFNLVLSKVKCIHMFFVFFKLGVIVLDKEKKVLAKFIISPWQISKFYPKAYYFIESPDLEIVKSAAIGETLSFGENN